ncbi:MAG: hypothetical protein JOZ98_01050 [Solirubrobacterales bacterium]|nr:hypothetical protein [Solirubrobacterales bacterium]
MSTIQTTLTPAPIRRSSAVVAAAGALLAVGIAVMFLVLASPTRSSHTVIGHPPPTYYPLIEYRGTGAPPPTRATPLTPGAPPTTALLRAEHSYGAVP